MAIKSYFFDVVYDGNTYDREYTSGDFASYLDKIVGNGVFSNPSTNLQVMASSGMDIVVKAGQAFIDGHKLVLDADMSFTLDNSDVLLDRIDRVVVYLDMTNRVMGIRVKKGTPDSPALYPDLVRDPTLREYCLANVRIAAQATAISQTNITDTRADTQICGFVSALIEQVDTATLYAQYQAAYQQFYESTQTQLEEFMQTLTEELGVSTYIKQFRKNVSAQNPSSITLDMTNYTYSSSDVIQVYINGLLGIVGEDYTVNVSGGVATVTLVGLTSTTLTQDIDIRVFKAEIGIVNSVPNS